MAPPEGQERDLYAAGRIVASVEARATAAEDEAERWRSLAVELAEALNRLVILKDGPRDRFYEVQKPIAWDRARAVVAKAETGHVLDPAATIFEGDE